MRQYDFKIYWLFALVVVWWSYMTFDAAHASFTALSWILINNMVSQVKDQDEDMD
jgi:hypothetical protein